MPHIYWDSVCWLSGMMNTIITGLPTFHHQREAGAVAGVAVILTPLTITAMKTITITTDMSTTITGAATKTRTMAMMTSRRLGEDEVEEAESAVVPARTGAVAPSHQGADWAFPRGEALEQAAEVKKKVCVCDAVSLWYQRFNSKLFPLLGTFCTCFPMVKNNLLHGFFLLLERRVD